MTGEPMVRLLPSTPGEDIIPDVLRERSIAAIATVLAEQRGPDASTPEDPFTVADVRAAVAVWERVMGPVLRVDAGLHMEKGHDV